MLGVGALTLQYRAQHPRQRRETLQGGENRQKRSHHLGYPATMGLHLPLSMKLP